MVEKVCRDCSLHWYGKDWKDFVQPINSLGTPLKEVNCACCGLIQVNFHGQRVGPPTNANCKCSETVGVEPKRND